MCYNKFSYYYLIISQKPGKADNIIYIFSFGIALRATDRNFALAFCFATFVAWTFIQSKNEPLDDLNQSKENESPEYQWLFHF